MSKTADVVAPAAKVAVPNFMKKNLREYGMLISLAVIMVFFQIITGGVLFRPVNLTNLVLQNSFVVIMALGNDPNPIIKDSEPSLKTTKWGTIDLGAKGSQKTSLDGIYSGGDAARGGSTAIRAAGGSAEAVAFDVTDRAATAAALEQLLAAGAIQILVNNAGIHADAVFPGMSGKQWDAVINVSLNGFYNVTQPLSMPMIRTRWGRIITISSVAGLTGNRGQVNYSAAKGALHAASKSLALELASRGITVNAVAPGIIATDMIEGAFDAETIKQLVPMKRAGQPEEVADLVAFLASDSAAYISGQVISINGGMI